MRIVQLRLSEEFLTELSENGVGQVDKRLTDAIGYLSMWGLNGRAKQVTIHGDRRGELVANYVNEAGDRVFTIGAVPDDNWNYSFHS